MTQDRQKVLLVGDLTTDLTLSSRLLENMGFETTIIDEYKTALKAIKQVEYDYVMVELYMSEANGDDIIENARKVTYKKNTKYILVTDGDFYRYFKDKGKSLDDCADVCIARPFTPDGIKNIFSELSKVDRLAIE